jgi:hypothetical protein
MTKTHRVRHNLAAGHCHTLAVVLDEGGMYWLEILCPKKDCSGVKKLSVLPEQIQFWEESKEALPLDNASILALS